MKFGENLYNLRKKEKISQEKLAEKVGVSRQSVSKWENGESYPEMNRILELCKIFHCQLNELVNDKILDFDSLDEDIKMSVVKLKKEEQKKMKGLSKALEVIAKIGRIICCVALPIVILVMIFALYFINNIDVKDNELIWKDSNEKIELTDENSKLTLKYNGMVIADEGEEIIKTEYIKILEDNSKFAIIGYIEVGVLSILITLILTIFILKHLEKLFKNINEGSTPFTLENVEHVSKMAWLMIATIIITNIGGAVFSGLITQDVSVEFEMFDLVQILFLFSMAYIFKYGYQIQLESNGIMYGDENE